MIELEDLIPGKLFKINKPCAITFWATESPNNNFKLKADKPSKILMLYVYKIGDHGYHYTYFLYGSNMIYSVLSNEALQGCLLELLDNV